MELFFAHLTVREHLRFHAINRNGGSKTIAKCEAMVEAVLGEMGLRRAADTIIGGGFLYYTKGENLLSGGHAGICCTACGRGLSNGVDLHGVHLQASVEGKGSGWRSPPSCCQSRVSCCW